MKQRRARIQSNILGKILIFSAYTGTYAVQGRTLALNFDPATLLNRTGKAVMHRVIRNVGNKHFTMLSNDVGGRALVWAKAAVR